MLCMLCCTTTQVTFGIQQRLLVLEILEIVSCGNQTRTIAVLTALSLRPRYANLPFGNLFKHDP